MGRQREDAEIDCATERDEKAEEEEMGGDEREDAESESHEDGGVGRDAGGDDDCFFESLDRVPSGVSFDLDLPSSASESDDDDNDDDVRVSFATAIEAPRFSICITDFDDFLHDDEDGSGGFDYGIWMAEPVSLSERRRRLLRGMGLASRKGIAPSKTFRDGNSAALRVASNRFRPPLPPSAASKPIPSAPSTPPLPAQFPSELTLSRPLLVRSLSDRHLPCQAPASARLLRSHSLPPSPWLGNGAVKNSGEFEAEARRENGQDAGGDAGACKIKNLDTGKEFVMSGIGKDGSFGRLNDVQTGLQLTMDEFDRFIGFSPLVKELMRRVNLAGDKKKTGGGKSSSTCGVKSSKSGGRKRGNWLKNIKFVASSVTGLISEREWDNGNSVSGAGATATSGGSGRKYSFLNGNSADRLKVHRHGKSHKELTGLYMSQEIQAHQGSIWCMRFSADGRFLASAGEDRTVHVWQVTESDPFSTFAIRRQETLISAAGPSPAANRSASSRSDHASILGAHASKRTRKESKPGSRRRSLPDYVVLPETIFSISESPACSFEGHLDDVLDLSWSKSQHLLSSSMDKTVRLWDMESKACLKLFAHNDYVTCIQFNPTDNDYFISGSLDGKARIWSIPNRQVVDWSDLHEMVTAVCYTPDGQGALVGSHKGSFRLYRTSDDKISQESQVDVRSKKKKSHAKKITGFQHAPGNSSEVMVTSADSQIRVFDGVNIVHKFRGFRNTSSQISASFSADGKYVVCASEDSNVYIWKRDAGRGGGGGGGKSKGWSTTRSHEYFYCKDVSVAVPWPNVGSNCEKPSLPSAFSKSLEAAGLEDPFSSGRSNRPLPVPPKKGSPEQVVLPTSPDAMQASLLGSSSPSRSLRSSVNSSSSFSSWGWGGGSSRVAAGGPESANAWGLVVVTAGLGGNIRVYQNFGLPVRLSRQNSLF